MPWALLAAQDTWVNKTTFLLSGIRFLLGGNILTSKEMNNKLVSDSDKWYQENETRCYVLMGFLFSTCGDRSPFWNPPTLKPIIESVPTMRPNRWQSSCPTVPRESTPSTPTPWLSAVTVGPARLPPRSVRPSEAGRPSEHSWRPAASRTHLHGQHKQLYPPCTQGLFNFDPTCGGGYLSPLPTLRRKAEAAYLC